MSDPQISELWFDAVAKVGVQIPGLAAGAVYALGTGGQNGVQPMPENLSEGGLPAFVLAYGGGAIIAGSWERQNHTLEGSIWVERTPLAERYAQLVGFIDLVMDTFPPLGKPHTAIASAVVTGFGRIEVREWPETTKYLVLPFDIEVVRNRTAQYVAAAPPP